MGFLTQHDGGPHLHSSHGMHLQHSGDSPAMRGLRGLVLEPTGSEQILRCDID
jgi:hypothetical protein